MIVGYMRELLGHAGGMPASHNGANHYPQCEERQEHTRCEKRPACTYTWSWNTKQRMPNTRCVPNQRNHYDRNRSVQPEKSPRTKPGAADDGDPTDCDEEPPIVTKESSG
jgi:hypothetical protein